MTTPKKRPPRAPRATQPRVTRPKLDRDAPDRSPGGYLGSTGRHPSMRTAQRVIELSVEGAYSVIQEYLRWGQRSAEQFTPFESRSKHMRDYHDDEYGDPSAQMFEMWQRMYMQWMSMFMPGMCGPMPPRPWGPMPPGPWGPMPPPGPRGHGKESVHGLELELTLHGSNRCANVSLHLDRPVWGGGEARMHSRECDETFTVAVSERGRVEVDLVETLPEGAYRGEIRNRDGMHCGHMKIRIS